MKETASNSETSKKNLPNNNALHPKERDNLKYTNLNILCSLTGHSGITVGK